MKIRNVINLVIMFGATISGFCLLFNPLMFNDTDLLLRSYGAFVILTIMTHLLQDYFKVKNDKMQKEVDELRKACVNDMMEDIKDLIKYKIEIIEFLLSIKSKSRLSKVDKTKIDEFTDV